MPEQNNIKNYYFIGIGGIGMSGLARYFKTRGFVVAGYDKTPSKMTAELQAEGIPVTFSDEIDAVPDYFFNIELAQIVYTPAIPKTHPQLMFFQHNSFNVKKRAEVLGDVTKNTNTLAVAGTHGKTTTTSILAHLLKASGLNITAFLGGVSENYKTNFINDGLDAIVVEADEFDRSFMHLSPNKIAITSMDADHLDIYGSHEELSHTFKDFADLVSDKSNVFVANGLPLKGVSVGVDDDSDISAKNITIENGAYHFSLKYHDKNIEGFQFNLPGKHNLHNAVTALALAVPFVSPSEKLARALTTFKGVQRRFTYRIKTEDLVLIDDYAHHPSEINAVHQAVREMHPNEKVLAVFQPHLFSRTRDFMNEFAESLSQFDEILLLDIYPAREEPIAGVTSEAVLELIQNENKKVVSKENLFEAITKSSAKVISMMGAGDIGEEILKVTRLMNKEKLKINN